MFTLIIKQCKVSFLLLLLMSILTGVIYPLIVTGIGQLIFPWQANGSLIKKNNIIVGSALIGQEFTDPQYFWGRPSATLPYPYNAQASSGSNLDPINDIFLNAVRARSVTLRQSDWSNPIAVPVDLITASGSGLDPEISPFAAEYQVNRVAKARGLPAQQVQQLLDRYTHGRTLGLLGEPRVNVLQVNLALDALQQRT